MLFPSSNAGVGLAAPRMQGTGQQRAEPKQSLCEVIKCAGTQRELISTGLSETRTDLQLNPSMFLQSFIKSVLWGKMHPSSPRGTILHHNVISELRTLKCFSRMAMGTDKTLTGQNY